MNLEKTTNLVAAQAETLTAIRQEVNKVIVGQEKLIDRLLIALITGGHILLEGVPGLAKTLSVKTLAQALGLQFQRISFTPDLLPADVIGTMIYNPKDATFTPKKGPVFTNLLLADEINRAPAKVQSALLEAMQERQVTIGQETFALARPFLVMATQNPIEQEGTYPLPEAQIDRFMMKVRVGYPTAQEEKLIMQLACSAAPRTVEGVVDAGLLEEASKAVAAIHMEDKIVEYIISLVGATRRPGDFGLKLSGMISYGASPRASIWLGAASRAHAFLQGRGYVTPQDVKAVAPDILRHRIILSYEAEAEGMTSDSIIDTLLERIEVP
jgi:MoxR-like ATPase